MTQLLVLLVLLSALVVSCGATSALSIRRDHKREREGIVMESSLVSTGLASPENQTGQALLVSTPRGGRAAFLGFRPYRDRFRLVGRSPYTGTLVPIAARRDLDELREREEYYAGLGYHELFIIEPWAG